MLDEAKTYMNTKEQILLAALDLFSIKGFYAVSIRDICKSVGIKESTIYYHYSNKQDIFDSLVCRMKNIYQEQIDYIGIADNLNGWEHLYDSKEHLFKVCYSLLLFYTSNDFVCKFRRVITIEQFGNEKIAELYQKLFFLDPIKEQSKLFESLIVAEIMTKKDVEQLAIEFYAPVFLLYQQNIYNEEQVKNILLKHIKSFEEHYMLIKSCEN